MKTTFSLVVIAILLSATTKISRALIIHVPQDYPTLIQGLYAANSGDTVLVSPGIYFGGFVIQGKGITLASYYLTTGDPSFILSTKLDGQGNQRVLLVDGETETNYIIGFTISHGYATTAYNKIVGGGGIAGNNLHIADNLIISNAAKGSFQEKNICGGGLLVFNSVIKNNSFCDNLCDILLNGYSGGKATGGGVYAENCQINDNYFENNICGSHAIASGTAVASACGGALNAIDCSIENCSFVGNKCTASGSASSDFDGEATAIAGTYGGAIYYKENSVVSLLRGSYFYQNSCESYASANAEQGSNQFGDAWAISEAKGGAVFNVSNVENCYFEKNSTSSTANANCSGNLCFEHPESNACGGAIGNSGITNCLLIMNGCTSLANGFDFISNSEGGGFWAEGYYAPDSITNCTLLYNYVDGNGSKKGGGAYNAICLNCILRYNTPDQVNFGDVTYSNIQFGYPGTGNIDLDPFFVGEGEHPYALLANSPCVDAGDPATNPANLPETDLAGLPRFRDGDGNGTVVIDMGAYEYNPPALNADFHASQHQVAPETEIQFFEDVGEINTLCTSYQWDFNEDGVIDSEDPNPVFYYPETGIFSVKLIATDTSGQVSDTAIKYDYITVFDLIPGFYANQTYGEIPLSVHFTDTTASEYTEISSWQWDLNLDGIIDSEDPNPVFTYTETGQFAVQLIVTDTCSLIFDTLTKYDFITVSGLHAGFNAYQTYGTTPLTVHFTDTSTTEYTEISTWQWDFDNNGTFDSNDQDPEWTYNVPGIWSVKLVIADTSGYIIDTLLKQDYIVSEPSAINEINPAASQLEVYPNPFTKTLYINYPAEAYGSVVTVRDPAGNIIRSFSLENMSADTTQLIWDGTGNAGHKTGNGLYLVCLESEGKIISVRKVLLLN